MITICNRKYFEHSSIAYCLPVLNTLHLVRGAVQGRDGRAIVTDREQGQDNAPLADVAMKNYANVERPT